MEGHITIAYVADVITKYDPSGFRCLGLWVFKGAIHVIQGSLSDAAIERVTVMTSLSCCKEDSGRSFQDQRAAIGESQFSKVETATVNSLFILCTDK